MITEQHISKLLYQHDCVIVPDLGGFIANYNPAGIHPVLHTFTPPSRTLVFNASLKNNDGLLADAIRTELGITFAEAISLIAEEVALMREKLNKGEQFSLSQIGILFYDREKNLQFNPDSSVNYHSDSFGLTNFTSPAIKREALHEKLSRRLKSPQAVRSARRLPATLKWAAVFLPFISMGIWATYNTDKVTSFYNNPASFMPAGWSSAEIPYKPAPKPIEKTKVVASIPDEIPVETTTAAVSEETIVAEPVNPDVFFVIAGAFGVQQNAENYVLDLRSKGFDSFIAGQNRRGLFMVSIEGFSDKQLAMQKMNEFRAGGFPNAWLLNRE
ncbi:MAG: SPOR domain-containing protein [Bacteroidales bacterium]|nr:SPOR domain-containing protein [Bacteroidales bacterium]